MSRIVHLINLYPPYVIGGNEMLARDITEAMQERGYDVHILTARGKELEAIPHVHSVFNYDLEEKDAIFLRTQPPAPSQVLGNYVFDVRTYRNVRRKVRELQPDLIVVDNMYQASAAPLLAVRDAPCPVVALVADKWLIYLLRDLALLLKPERPLQRRLLQQYVKRVQPLLWRLGKPDQIFSVSDFIKQFYVRAGFPEDWIEPTYLGVDTSLYTPRHNPHNGKNHLEVIFAGQLWEGKGPQVLVEAMGRLRERQPDLELRLRIVGRGSDAFMAFLQREIERYGMADRTMLDGFVPLSVLAQRLREGDIYVFPSTWEEPFSITLVAAMASGIPVVATRTGGTPEAFEDGQEGLLIDPGDAEVLAQAIRDLARDPALRNRLSQAAVERVQRRWSFQAYIDRLERHYQDAMRRGRRTT